MNDDRFDVLDRFEPLFEAPEPSFEGFARRRDRRRRNQRITAGAVGLAVFVAAVWFVTGTVRSDRAQTPGTPGAETGPTVTGPSAVPGTLEFDRHVATASWVTSERYEADFVIDLDTGEATPLPESILTPLAPDPRGGRYAASPDGSTLAFVGLGADGTRQIFVAGIDGAGVRQVTNDPTGASSPAWSPDGTRIAYQGHSEERDSLFVLSLATGEVTKVLDAGTAWDPTFTPDGASLVYTGGSGHRPVLMTAPLAGGSSSVLVEPGEGIDDSGNGSLSPDGSLVTFLGSGFPASGEGHCGPCRFVANADGTDKRVIRGWMATPAGMWSPDGSRIVSMELLGQIVELEPGQNGPQIIVVVDVSTGDATYVANGDAAIWVNDHTLVVQV